MVDSKLKLLVTVLFATGWLVGAGYVSAATYEVHPDGSGDYATIQDAVDAVVDGDIIELTDGIFATWDDNRDVNFSGKKITVRSKNGDPTACIIDCGGSTTNPHRGFNFVSGEDADSVLEGVTITNGFTPTSWGDPCWGGGAIYCINSSSPTINNCIISHNRAEGLGGGMYCGAGCAPDINDCLFYHNTALDDGGGLANFGSPTIRNCTFWHNHTQGHGGGMTDMGDNVTFTNCSFSHNTADTYGGGLSVFEDPNCVLEYCTFSENSTRGNGGAILTGKSHSTLVNCTLSDNEGDPNGSGLAVTWPTPLWDSNAVLENTIIAFGRKGEAVYCETGLSATLTCCDVYGNAGGDWVGCLAGQNGTNGNISLDPLFCNRPAEDFTLHNDSPCDAVCGLMGAWPVGCIYGDLDSDDDVDFMDLAIFAAHWLDSI